MGSLELMYVILVSSKQQEVSVKNYSIISPV